MKASFSILKYFLKTENVFSKSPRLMFKKPPNLKKMLLGLVFKKPWSQRY